MVLIGAFVDVLVMIVKLYTVIAVISRRKLIINDDSILVTLFL